MYFASFGLPPDNPDDVRLMTLRDFIDLQGNNPKKWKIKPYCPHCKTEALHPYDIKGAALGFRLAALHVSEHRPSPGFHHQDKKAEPDCPYSFDDDARYKRGVSDVAARRREIDRNKKELKKPKCMEDNEEILRFLLQRLTGQEALSSQIRRMADLAAEQIISTPGLASHPWLEPYFKAKWLSSFLRIFSPIQKREDISLPPLLPLKVPQFDQRRQRSRKSKKKPLREVAYQNLGYQSLTIQYKGRERTIAVPRLLRLCVVQRENDTVAFIPILSGKQKKTVDFEISARFAQGIVDLAHKRARKKLVQEELIRKLPGYKDRPQRTRRKPRVEGQSWIL